MKSKIPPLVVALVFAIAMFALAKILPVGYFDFFGRQYLVVVLIGLAFFLGSVALFQFWRQKTTHNPLTPHKASFLVTNGVYRFTRNPMYLALLLLLLAWGTWLGNAFNTLLAAGFVSFMNRFQIGPEEEALTVLFGKAYRQYLLNVRRWF